MNLLTDKQFTLHLNMFCNDIEKSTVCLLANGKWAGEASYRSLRGVWEAELLAPSDCYVRVLGEYPTRAEALAALWDSRHLAV